MASGWVKPVQEFVALIDILMAAGRCLGWNWCWVWCGCHTVDMSVVCWMRGKTLIILCQWVTGGPGSHDSRAQFQSQSPRVTVTDACSMLRCFDACVWSTAFVKFNWEASWAFGSWFHFFAAAAAAALHSHQLYSAPVAVPTFVGLLFVYYLFRFNYLFVAIVGPASCGPQ